MDIKGVIFDLDGVIVSTDEYHYKSWKSIADKKGIFFDEKINERLRGVSRSESLEIILEKSLTKYSENEKLEMMEEKNKVYKAFLNNLKKDDMLPGVYTTLTKLKTSGVKTAIGSSSKNAGFILERLGLANFFDAVSDGNNITRSKPDPEVFLKAAFFLGLPPSLCLVVEDAEAGIEAAKAGGFISAAVGSARSCQKADYDLNSFDQLLDIVPH